MPNWGHVLKEIQKETNDLNGDSAIDKVRKKYLMQLHNHVGRNIICYYSGWLSKSKIEGVEINDEDKNGFMLCIHKLDRSKGLDLFLHTPGGSGAATASLVDYLRQMFGTDIRAFVPQMAMSAGTIIACACKEIFMGKHSNLGPVDPQINGIPAHAVIAELQMAYDEMVADPRRQFVWNPILSRYTPSFVKQCHWAIQNGKDFVGAFLAANMFSQLIEPEKTTRVNAIVDRLTDLSRNKGHDKHLHPQECKDMGLEIRELEDPKDKTLQDLVLTVHHCYMFALCNTPVFKIIEKLGPAVYENAARATAFPDAGGPSAAAAITYP
jgi:Serine dehydrogenase proteinase